MAKRNKSGGRQLSLPESLRPAVTAHQRGDLQAAYPLYREFIAANPRHAAALQLFGLLLSQLGQLDPAIRMMRESLRLDPAQPDVARNLGFALLRAGRFDEALEWLEHCLESAPDDASAWLATGNVYQQRNELDKAVTALEKAIEIAPDFAEAHHNLGVCNRLRNFPERALENYRRAAKLGIDRAELHHNMGNAYIDAQQAGPAIDAYREALKRDPLNPDTHKNLNSLLWQHEQLDDYLKSYEEALAANPGAEILRIAYAVALIQTDEHEQAERVLRDGLPNSRSGELRSLIARALEGQRRWDEALELHKEAVNMPDATPDHRVSFGRALLACRRPSEALEQIEAGATAAPLNQRTLAYLGLCWRMLGDERDAYLNDYDTMVVPFDLPVPEGFSSIAEFNERLRQMLEPLHIGLRHPAEQTLRGGSQTSGNLFDRREPEIKALVGSLRLCIEDYIARFPDDDEHPLYKRRTGRFGFNASWSVRLVRSGYHTMHTHPLGWISSAYYVQVPAEISAGDTHGGGIKFGQPDIDIGAAGAARRKIQPSPGRLVLFPSYMWHGTIPFDSDEPRMTTPFDVVPL